MRDADFVKAMVAGSGSAPMPREAGHVIVDSGEECGSVLVSPVSAI